MALAVDFSGLNAWADAMATILLIELCVLLLIIAALLAVLAYGARWLQQHVLPLLNTTVPVARQALDVTNQSTDRVVRGVAEVYGIRSALDTAARVVLYGKDGNRPALRAEQAAGAQVGTSQVQAATQLTTPRQPTRQSGSAAPAERRAPPATEPRQPDQPFDNMTANAS
jgi:hypothetical protein